MANDKALSFIREAEGVRLDAYPDGIKGWSLPTIGYGNTKYEDGSPVKRGDTITRERAESLLVSVFKQKYLPALEAIPNWNIMTQSQQAALASFTWNHGPAWYTNQTFYKLIGLLDNMQWDEVAKEFYGFLGGPDANPRIKAMLKSRRIAEGFMWYGAKIMIYNAWTYNPISDASVDVHAPATTLPWAVGTPGTWPSILCDIDDYRTLPDWMLTTVYKGGTPYDWNTGT